MIRPTTYQRTCQNPYPRTFWDYFLVEALFVFLLLPPIKKNYEGVIQL